MMKTYYKVNIRLNGELFNRRSKREFDSLLFDIHDYVGLKSQITQQKKGCLYGKGL